MGNSVFRYFQEWLRVQMREDAYRRYLRRAERSAARRRAAGTDDAQSPFGRAWGRYRRPGGADALREDDTDLWDEGARFSIEHFERGLPERNQTDERFELPVDEPSREHPKLWELAKMEGDGEWIEWMGKHVWTYVGLGAPLLGAPGPLRSVLSGENMGLPFTDEEARTLELCE